MFRSSTKIALLAAALMILVSTLFAADAPAAKAGKGGKARRAGKTAKKDAAAAPGGAFTLTNPAVAQRQEIYKRVAGTELKIDIFEPKQKEAGKKYPVIVFFFGGGWTNGMPSQFYRHCEHLASRGMIAMAADYRVKSRQPATTPAECVKDAKSAIRWVRANAARLGIDPTRIAAGGGSAGGHIAAAAATASGYEEEGEDASVSCRPDALVLFNPFIGSAGQKLEVDDKVRTIPAALLPIENVKAGLPPTIVMIGSEDNVIPVSVASQFQKKMKEAGNRCELRVYEGQTHGFFNYGRQPDQEYYKKTLAEAGKFLTSLGWLPEK